MVSRFVGHGMLCTLKIGLILKISDDYVDVTTNNIFMNWNNTVMQEWAGKNQMCPTLYNFLFVTNKTLVDVL